MPDLIERLSTTLGDRYRVERHLGTGGMASVFLAHDLRHDRPVAVKVVRPELAQAIGPDRFIREIRITAGLTHPNIPPLLDSGDADGLLFYVMPYLAGATLADRLKADGRLGVEETLVIGRELADALAFAHRAGVVHRDVKPSNVFLEEGHALLGDFGVALSQDATSSERLTSSEIVLGTAEYMSPEQCSGSHAVDARSDIYSLGCLLYEALAGEPPFVGRSRIAVVARQLAEAVPPLSSMRGDVPPYVTKVVERCLAKAPADRFRDAEALRGALDKALGQLRGHEGTGRAQRPRWAGIMGSTSVVVVLLVATMLLWPTSSPAVNATRVVGFPLADRGGGVEMGGDIALMIGNAFLHTDPLQWVDGWERLTPQQRSDPAQVTIAEARAITLARGARHFVTGGIVRSGDSLTVRLTLHDAVGDSVVSETAVAGRVGIDSPERLGLRAAVQLLPSLLAPGRPVDLAPLMDRDPAGVALWIQGDRAYRRARFADALTYYRRALEADSLLVFAALKGARAASWEEEPEVADDLVRLASRHDTLLPLSQRPYLTALRAYQSGQADSAVAALRLALASDADDPETWALLGEVNRHLVPAGIAPADSARSAFEEALRRDPGFRPAAVHLAEEAIRAGDLAHARELVGRLQADSATDAPAWVRLMLECEEASLPRMGFSVPQPLIEDVLLAATHLAAGGARPECAEAGFRQVRGRTEATAGERWGALLGLQGLLVAEGRVAEVDSLLEDALASGEGAVRFVFALDVAAGADLSARAASVDEEAAGLWGPTYEATVPLTLWALTLWNTAEGDTATARVLVDRLETVAATRGDAATRLLADAGQAHLWLAEGDSARALAAFSALRPTGPRSTLQWGLAEPLPAERIRLAELLLASGRAEEAYGVAAVFDHPQPANFLAFLARSLEIRETAARALRGSAWTLRAEEARRRLDALRNAKSVSPPDGGRK